MSLTLKHFWNARRSRKPYAMQDSSYFDLKTGIVTLQYPHQTLPVPDNGRYQLDCEIDDCIVCDKCAKVCPVDCIDIEPIKSAEVISYTSDGSPVRLYAAKFDIDMAKCCFCGLCTTVCPTECLTMTNEYDFSVVDITQMNFGFSNLSAEQADKKRKLYEQYVVEKEELKKGSVQVPKSNEVPLAAESANKPKPSFKPAFKPVVKTTENTDNEALKEKAAEPTQSKPAFKPAFKPIIKSAENQEVKEEKSESTPATKPAFKPSFKPVMKTVQKPENEAIKDEKQESIAAPKPVFKPSFKPAVKAANSEDKDIKSDKQEPVATSKPVFKPTFKPKFTQPTITGNIEVANKSVQSTSTQDTPKSKPVFKPTIKITPKDK